MDFRSTLKRYYILAKPGIVYSNAMTAIAGYLFAARLDIDWLVLTGLVGGVMGVIAGACAYNNYFDRNIDKAMHRTRKRGLVTGELQGWQALFFATALTGIGFGVLLVTQNTTTIWLALIAFVDYVFLYTFGKRYTVHGTLIGSISGSIPLVAGYTAVTNNFDGTATLLFLLMVAWQMVHFYGIALFRAKDYRAAHVPVLPVVRGSQQTKQQMLAYILLFVVVAGTMLITRTVGYIVGSLLLLLGLVWLVKAVRAYRRLPAEVWGKQTFLFSLIVLLGMAFLLAIDPLLV